MRLPCAIPRVGWLSWGRGVGHFVMHFASQSRMDTVPIVIMFEGFQFLFQVPLAPEEHPVQIFTPRVPMSRSTRRLVIVRSWSVATFGGRIRDKGRHEASLQTTRKQAAGRLPSSFVSNSVSVLLQNNPSMERNKSCTTRHPGLRVKSKTLAFPLKTRVLSINPLKNGGA